MLLTTIEIDEAAARTIEVEYHKYDQCDQDDKTGKSQSVQFFLIIYRVTNEETTDQGK